VAEELIEVARSAPDAALLVDEAYFEFYGKTMLDRREEAPNVFVARTFSKAYGLAGLRIGVLVGDREQMRALRRASSPYNVNAIALACLPEAVGDQAYIRQYVDEVRETRARVETALGECGLQLWPSHANFVLARVGSYQTNSARFVEEMRRRGILVRDRSSDYGCEGCVRITCGPRQHAEQLLTALSEACREVGIMQGASQR
jgi:histidinol-phosphate aminotransferase